jgi:hypothetical protein
MMLSQKVQDTCTKYGYIHCDKCPLQVVCEIDHHRLPGITERAQVALWEKIVNMVAEEDRE